MKKESSKSEPALGHRVHRSVLAVKLPTIQYPAPSAALLNSTLFFGATWL
jgi:hypothetical protein